MIYPDMSRFMLWGKALLTLLADNDLWEADEQMRVKATHVENS